MSGGGETDEELDTLLGTVLLDKLRVESVLGRGGMGTVYRVTHLGTQHARALKILRPEIQLHSEALLRFQREATVSGILNSPYVVETIDTGSLPDGSLYVLMELLDGHPLSDVVGRGPVPPARIVPLLRQACRALGQAHDKGIVHRDIKPDNLFVVRDEDGQERINILDFGIARFRTPFDVEGSRTREHAVLGTPLYMAPEQIGNAGAADGRADVYAIGVVLYEALSGRKPYEASSFAELVARIYDGSSTPLERTAPGLIPLAYEVVRRAMARKPEDRYQSMEELDAALGDIERSEVSLAGTLASDLRPILWPPRMPAGLDVPKDSSRDSGLDRAVLAFGRAILSLVTWTGDRCRPRNHHGARDRGRVGRPRWCRWDRRPSRIGGSDRRRLSHHRGAARPSAACANGRRFVQRGRCERAYQRRCAVACDRAVDRCGRERGSPARRAPRCGSLTLGPRRAGRGLRRRRTMSALARCVLVGALLLVAPSALAQPTARERLARAIERYESALGQRDPERRRADLEAALAELDEANRLGSDPLIEWNLALVEHELGRPVLALAHVERYLASAGSGHSRRAEAEVLAATLRGRVAEIWIDTELANAEIFVGAERAGTTPQADWIRVPAGELVVELRRPGWRAASARIRVAGETRTRVRLAPERDPTAVGQLFVRSALDGVAVRIDGAAIGETPLAASVPLLPGSHVISASRAGYLPITLRTEIVAGAEASLDLVLEIDPAGTLGTLSIALPAAPAVVLIDRVPRVFEGTIDLPPGVHEIVLEVADRDPWTGTVNIEAGAVATLVPDLRFDAATLARLRSGAEVQRLTGVVALVTGAALLAAGGVVLAHLAADTLPWRDRNAASLMACRAMRPAMCGTEFFRLEAEIARLDELVPIEAGVGVPLAAIGGIALAVGIWVSLDAPSDEAIQRRARATIGIGPARLALSFRF